MVRLSAVAGVYGSCSVTDVRKPREVVVMKRYRG
jgi:hypothetical protein